MSSVCTYLRVGLDVSPIQALCYILQYSVTFLWLKWTQVDKLTQSLGFIIPLHLYIHDHDSQWAVCAPCLMVRHVRTPNTCICYILQYSITFSWLKWTPVDKLTQNLGFRIPFHLYIHDQDWQWTGYTPTGGSDMHCKNMRVALTNLGYLSYNQVIWCAMGYHYKYMGPLEAT